MPLITLNQIADLLLVEPRWINRLVKERGFPKEGHGQYDLKECVNWYVRFLKEENKNKNNTEGYSEAKARKEIALANKQELEFLVNAGKYLPVDLIEDSWFKQFSTYNKLLDAILIKEANKLLRAKTKSEIATIIKEALYKIRDEFATTDISQSDTGENNIKEPEVTRKQSAKSSKAKGTAKRKRVGKKKSSNRTTRR